jgi:hypothetical protein
MQYTNINIGPIQVAQFTGNKYYVAPAGWVNPTGVDAPSDGADGTDIQRPLATIAAAYAKCVSGNNDVIILLSDGTNDHVISAAITWAKNCVHMVGAAALNFGGPAVRIKTLVGATAFNALNVTGSNCYFGNFQLLQLFTTDSATGICHQDSGTSNTYDNVKIIGIAGAAALAGTGARHSKLSGVGTTFNNCWFGSSAYVRSVANASIEIASPAAGIVFNYCTIEVKGSAAGVLMLLTVAAGATAGAVTFVNCDFLNDIPGSTQLTVAYSATAALTAAYISMNNCMLVGATKWGDTNGLASLRVMSTTSTAASAGLAVAPA